MAAIRLTWDDFSIFKNQFASRTLPFFSTITTTLSHTERTACPCDCWARGLGRFYVLGTVVRKMPSVNFIPCARHISMQIEDSNVFDDLFVSILRFDWIYSERNLNFINFFKHFWTLWSGVIMSFDTKYIFLRLFHTISFIFSVHFWICRANFS